MQQYYVVANWAKINVAVAVVVVYWSNRQLFSIVVSFAQEVDVIKEHTMVLVVTVVFELIAITLLSQDLMILLWGSYILRPMVGYDSIVSTTRFSSLYSQFTYYSFSHISISPLTPYHTLPHSDPLFIPSRVITICQLKKCLVFWVDFTNSKLVLFLVI